VVVERVRGKWVPLDAGDSNKWTSNYRTTIHHSWPVGLHAADELQELDQTGP